MSDQIISLLGDFTTYLPWVSFLAGIGGSLHCAGMCGGLVTASCGRSRDVIGYQFGRLGGYLGLGFFSGALGSFLSLKNLPGYLSIIPPLIMGLVFIFWGFQNFKGIRAELPVPGMLRKIYTSLWIKLVRDNKNVSQSFFTGFISILLPCGLLYGVVLGTVTLQNTTHALSSMFFFWLGTVPSMIVAPKIIQRFLRPLKNKLPKTYAISLMAIGLMTITFRVMKVYDHKNDLKSQSQVHKCH